MIIGVSMKLNILRKLKIFSNRSNGDLIKDINASDIMIRPVYLNPKDRSSDILGKLEDEDVKACIVVSDDKMLLGMITERDIIKLFVNQIRKEPLVKLFNHGYRRDFIFKTAGDIMIKDPPYVRKDTPINEVIETLWHERLDYVPVKDSHDRVLGVVTASGIIRFLKNY